MDKLFESKIMIRVQDFGQKLGSNKFLSSLQAAMMSVLGVIMIGALSQIAAAVGSEKILNIFKTGDTVFNLVSLPYEFTMNLLSLWVVSLLTYNYARTLKLKSPVLVMIDALISFMVATGTIIVASDKTVGVSMTYLGAQGMFIGFVVVLITVTIEKWCVDKDIRFKMPDVVPPFLQDSFSSILPLFFSLALFSLASGIITITTGANYTIASGFMALISKPLSALTSVAGVIILCTFAGVLWTLGIHGTAIIIPILLPVTIQGSAANAAAVAAGQDPVFYPAFLFSFLAVAGGSGNTWALSLFGLRSKSKQISAIAKISLVPGWFRINEPLTFGLPIMYNPLLAIPFVLNIPIVLLITYLGYQSGLLMPSWIQITALLPIGVASYLKTLRWENALWDYLMIIPSGIIYYPFYKIYERQLIKREAEEALEHEHTESEDI